MLLEMAGEGPVGGRRGAYSPKTLLSALQRVHPSFRGYYQHDAHEMFMRLVGTLEDEEDSFIKKRRQEEREAEEEEDEEEEEEEKDKGCTGGDNNGGGNPRHGIEHTNGSEGGGGDSIGQANADNTVADPAACQSPGPPTEGVLARDSGNGGAVVPYAAEWSADGASGEEKVEVAKLGAQDEGPAAVSAESLKEHGAPVDAALPEAGSAVAAENGESYPNSEGKGLADDDTAEDPSSSVWTNPGSDDGGTDEACVGNGEATGKRSDHGAGAGATRAESATPTREDDSRTGPVPDEDGVDDSEGFQLSAKQKRKVARQEREKRRLMEAEAKAREGTGGDAADGTGQGGGDDTAEAVVDKPAHETPQDEREEASEPSGTDLGDEGEDGASEALLPGFQLSAKEQKKIARQEKIGRQRLTEAEAKACSEEERRSASQTPRHEEGETADGGGEVVDAIASTAAGSDEGSPADGTDVEAVVTAEKPRGQEEEFQEAAVVLDGTHTSGSDIGDGDGSAGNTGLASMTPKPTDSAVPGAESLGSSGHESRNGDTSIPHSTSRAAGVCERVDCNGGSVDAGSPPPPPTAREDSLAGIASGGQVGQGTGAVAGTVSNGQEQQAAEMGLRDRFEADGNLDGAGTFSSSSSLGGCTTGDTQGSTDVCEDGRSAFGSECSEGNGNDKKYEESAAAPTNGLSKCLDGPEVFESEAERERQRSHSRAPDSTTACLEGGDGSVEGKAVGVERDRESQSAGGGAAADENGGDKHADSSHANGDRCGGEEEASSVAVSPATASPPGAAAAAVPRNPLDRLQEPSARKKLERRHDPDGIDLYGCLDHFMAEEKLVAADGNGYHCESCSSREEAAAAAAGGEGGVKAKEGATRSHQNARKRLLMLGQPPGVLVCHLKRLQAKKKIIRSVEFPIELDMTPYFWLDPDAPLSPTQTRYCLSGLVQHRGSRLGGHYIAYVRDRDGWKHASDSAIRTATLPEIKACEAYMLFYECCDLIDPVVADAAEGSVGSVSDGGVHQLDGRERKADENTGEPGVEALDKAKADENVEGSGVEVLDGADEKTEEPSVHVPEKADEQAGEPGAKALDEVGKKAEESGMKVLEKVGGSGVQTLDEANEDAKEAGVDVLDEVDKNEGEPGGQALDELEGETAVVPVGPCKGQEGGGVTEPSGEGKGERKDESVTSVGAVDEKGGSSGASAGEQDQEQNAEPVASSEGRGEAEASGYVQV
ncbi:ubiquitin carboxyl-terminal hydrolase 2 [Ectocarpus siliculosus]|uniref:ubiquitinyl hydrolase 1 n=1 Tax=Ectocarpus siliculosus TaxID=2880 RepID=D7FRB3_ECTSI|nr:ubiquitin carboxyl-terminal hydrolase 2 [Ectocarpus siliculosus]|eukprot:CBJ30704.1 ubiquitin carboxyl-terminal hydrolase 2 [Ectocarpus siliculosus]